MEKARLSLAAADGQLLLDARIERLLNQLRLVGVSEAKINEARSWLRVDRNLSFERVEEIVDWIVESALKATMCEAPLGASYRSPIAALV